MKFNFDLTHSLKKIDRSLFLLSSIVFSLLLIFANQLQANALTLGVFIEAHSSQAELGFIDPAIVKRQRAVNINFEKITDKSAILHLNNFSDLELIADRKQIELKTNGNFAWYGSIQGVENSEVTLVIQDGKLSGNINLDHTLIHIRHMKDDLHVIREIDMATLQERLYSIASEKILELKNSADVAGDTSSVPITENLSFSSIELEVVDLVNQERAVVGLHPLAADELLGNAARKHSEDMSQNNYFSHTSLDGRSPAQRISAEGYSFNTWGENIAGGYSSATAVMNGWMNSPGHRDNILNSRFCDIGVGHEPTRRNWTQVFSRKSGTSTCPDIIDPNPNPNPNPAEELNNGVAKNYNLADNSTIEFTIKVPANVENLKVTVSGNGESGIYVKRLPINWPSDAAYHDEAEFKVGWNSGTSASVAFNQPAQATWHVLVYGLTASPGQIIANWELSNTNPNPNPTKLLNGETRNYSINQLEIQEFTIDVPGNTGFLFVSINGTGDADLYVKRAPINWPADLGPHNEAEFQSQWILGSSEYAYFENPAQDTWHILLYGDAASVGTIEVYWWQ